MGSKINKKRRNQIAQRNQKLIGWILIACGVIVLATIIVAIVIFANSGGNPCNNNCNYHSGGEECHCHGNCNNNDCECHGSH